jgi:flagellar hook-associated protein 3 FlgL
MRISTNTLFDGASARLTDLQSQLNRTSQQVGSGQKVLTPSDDPVAAARALEVQQSSSINDQYAKNRLNLKNSLGVMDGSLSSIVNTLQSMHEQVVVAGNGTLSDSDRAAIAGVMQGQLDQLLSLANSTDGAGHSLFAGQQSSAAAFTADPTSGVISYQGDSTLQSVQVDVSRQMAITQSGQTLFPNSDIFNQMRATIADLQTPNLPGTTHTTQLNAMGGTLAQTLSSVNTVQATVGTQLQQIDMLDSVGSDRNVQYQQTLSDLQALDYNTALSDLSRQQMALQVAQKSFQQISQLSLFNYIN